MKILLTGEKNSGKSTFAYNMCKNRCSGVICLPVFENGIKIGSDAINLIDGKRKIFSRIKEKANYEGIEMHNYIISHEGMKHAIKAIEMGLKSKKMIVLDEIGNIEMKHFGYYFILKKILDSNKNAIIIVRKSIIKKFMEEFPGNYIIIEISIV